MVVSPVSPFGPPGLSGEQHAAHRAQRAGPPGALDPPRARRRLKDPTRMVEELPDAMEEAWRALVAADRPRLRTLLEADVTFHSRRLAEAGPGGLLPEINRRFGRHALTVEFKGEHERRLGGQRLVLMLSVFIWPDVVSTFDPPWQPTLACPARGTGGLWAGPAHRASDVLVLLLGRRRAAVLAALDEPATTSALAHRLDLAPSSVYAHLTLLRDAGLLTARRYGHQVLYERTPLGMALMSSDV
ncbi:ArsR/SmtB family transcription factor [Streptomyces guryensis]|uniref:ArsR/SmtB family transcription factor n=1 Tax=Streptomyces guryensis TaxID=2886947 RepID=UPI0035583B77